MIIEPSGESNKDESNAVVVVTNREFYHYAKALVNSIRANWEDHPEVLLFVRKDPTGKWTPTEDPVEDARTIEYDPADFEYRKLLSDGNQAFGTQAFNDAGFFILNAWGDLLSKYDTVLVLDADMLVLKNLNALLHDESFFGVSAANERLLPVFNVPGSIPKKIAGLVTAYAAALAEGIYVPPHVSLNSGVIRLARRDRTRQDYLKLLDLTKKFRQYCMSDQEIILLWSKLRKKPISMDFRFNFQARFYNAIAEGSLPKKFAPEVVKASNDVHILHFNGPKPDTPGFLQHAWTRGRTDLKELFYSYL
ncbi:MAG: glycosyltransferase [Catalinimonas sp.]